MPILTFDDLIIEMLRFLEIHNPKNKGKDNHFK